MREKRRFIRFDIALKIAYIVQKDPKIEKFSTTINISAQGLQLLTSDKLELGDNVDLKIFLPEALNPAHVRGVVVWSKELGAVESPIRHCSADVGTNGVSNGASHPYSAGIDFEKIEEDNKNTFLKFLCSLMRAEDKKEE